MINSLGLSNDEISNAIDSEQLSKDEDNYELGNIIDEKEVLDADKSNNSDLNNIKSI